MARSSSVARTRSGRAYSAYPTPRRAIGSILNAAVSSAVSRGGRRLSNYLAESAVSGASRVGRSFVNRLRAASVTPSEAVSGRRMSTSASASSAATGTVASTNVTHARAMKIKTNKKVKIRAPRRVKVSRKLRRKISKVIEGKSVHGTLDVIRSDGKLLLKDIAPNTQAVICGNNDGRFPWMFTADQFFTAASTLFNGYLQTGTAGTFVGDPTMPLYLDPKTTQFVVVDSWSSYSYKNLSSRALTLKIYECAPNEIGWTNTTAPGTNASWNLSSGGAWSVDSVTTMDNYSDPQQEWAQCLLGEQGVGRFVTTAGGAIAQVTQSQPNMIPTKSGKFNGRFKVSVRYICLCPGQVYDFTVQGPKNLKINGETLLKEGKWYNVRKYSRCIMTVALPDLATQYANTPVTGYNQVAPGSSTVLGSALAMARRDHYKISVPENCVVANRRDISVWNDFSNTAAVNTGVNVAPQQPAQPTGF